MRTKRSVALRIVAGTVVMGVAVWSFPTGPPARRTGAPAPNGATEATCRASNCHTGTTVANSPQITLTGGDTYTPGQTLNLTLTIADPAGVRFGFQASARLASDETRPAGSWTPATGQQVECEDNTPRPTAGCTAGLANQYIEHNRVISGTNAIPLTFVAPATNVGDISIFVAANAIVTGLGNTNTHLRKFTIRAAAAAPPAISEGGVTMATAFGGVNRTISPGSWIEIYGTNLAPNTREWAGSDFSGTNAPTALDNTRVTIGGQNAFVRLISPSQINVQVPNVGVGPTTMTVTNPAGTSANFNITVAQRTPSFLAIPSFRVGDRQFITAIHPETTNPNAPIFCGGNAGGSIPGTFRDGRLCILYGIGFGETSPVIAPGVISAGNPAMPNLQMAINDVPVTPLSATLTTGTIGLYQFNIVIPSSIPNGDHPLTGSIGGTPFPSNLFISVRGQ